MTILEIVLIVIGLAAVAISFRLSDDKNNNESTKSLKTTEDINDEDSPAFERMQAFDESELKEKIDDLINHADDELSRMLNEKIMGFSEYSDQIFDKMEKNHGEVVFLYNMLGEKEKEIKELIHDADTSKAMLREQIVDDYKDIENIDDKSSVYDAEIKRIELEESKNKILEERQQEVADAVNNLSPDSEKESSGVKVINDISDEKSEKNYNKEIIDLYKKGHSVLEISKILSIGQGEVKFVIDLYDAR